MLDRFLDWIAHTVIYTKARLNERSTWVAITAGIAGASALAAPWRYLTVMAAIVGALVPTSSRVEGE